MELAKLVLLLSAVQLCTYAEVYDITTMYRLNEIDTSRSSEKGPCIDIGTIEIHARTNALGVSLYVPRPDKSSRYSAQESVLVASPECGACGWTLDKWLDKSKEYMMSEPTLVANQQESGNCKYDAVQVDRGVAGGPTGVQGRLESPRGDTSENWTIRSSQNQRIKLVLTDLGGGHRTQSAEMQSYELDDYAVKLGLSERQVQSGHYEQANLTADYILSRDNFLHVHVEKNIQKSFAAVYFFESREQWTLYERSGALTSRVTVPSADKLCLALLLRTTRARGTVLDVVAQFLDGRDVHIGRWKDIQENTWTYVRLTADIESDYTDKEMRILIVAAQEEGATLYIRKIEECDSEEQQSTVVVKKAVSLPVEFRRKSERTTVFPQELNGKCINGGILTREGGLCVCPPGFAGTFCSEGCGPNKYGGDCGGKCSSFNKGCKGVVMCKYEVGCDCAPGFRGPLCSLRCAEGDYGFGCRQKCGQCEGDVACDPFTGVCPAGCLAGYFGELCLYKYTYLATAPVVYTHGPHDLEVVFKKELTQGRGLPRFYKIQYKKDGEERWTSRQTHKLEEDSHIVTTNITGLLTWTYYAVRVVIIDLDLNSYEGDDVPYTTVRTSCVVPEQVEYYIHSSDVKENSFQVSWLYEQLEDWCPLKYFEAYLKDSWRWVVYDRTTEHSANFTDLLAGKKHRAKVRAVTVQGPTKYSKSIVVVTGDQVPEMVLNLHQSSSKGREIEITWKMPRFTAGRIKHYSIVYKCKQLVACPTEDCSYSAGQMKVDTTHATLSTLIPHAQYYVSVSAVSGSQGPAAIMFPATDFTAPDIAPEASEQFATNRTEHGFTVHWQMPRNCTGLNGFLSRYYCELVEEDAHRVVSRGFTENNHANFDGLQSSTQYSVRVYYINTSGWSRKHALVIRVRTRSPGEQETTPAWEYVPREHTTEQTEPTSQGTTEQDSEYTTTMPATTSTNGWDTYQYEEGSRSQEGGSHSHGEDERKSSDEDGRRRESGSAESASDSTEIEEESRVSGENEVNIESSWDGDDDVYSSKGTDGHEQESGIRSSSKEDEPKELSLGLGSTENGGDYINLSFLEEDEGQQTSTTESSSWW